MTRRLPAAPDEAWLRERYVIDRLSAERIAEQVGCSSQFVRDQLRRHGIPLRPPGGGARSGRTLVLAQLEAMVAEGDSVANIAAAAGFSRSAIYQRIRRDRLTLTPRSTARPTDDVLVDQIVELYVTDRASIRRVADTVDRSTDWVRTRLLAAGVTLRSHAEQRALAGVDHTDIAARLQAGQSLSDIAAATNRSPDTLRQLARQHGWPLTPTVRSPRPPSLAPLDVDVVRHLYCEQRGTIAEVAAHLGCSAHQVRATLVAAGIPRRAAGRRDDTRPAPITAATLTELYIDQQLSVPAIAARLDTSTTRVRAALARHGIPLRPRYTRLPPLPIDRQTLTDLHITQGLDDEAIATLLHVTTHRVRTRRRQLGVTRPAVPPPHPTPPQPPPAEELIRLYSDAGTPLEVIARAHHTSKQVVRQWLVDADIPVRPRTSRSHRRQIDPTLLRELYVDREWSAVQIALDQHTTQFAVLRSLHDNAIPVRPGGPPGREPSPARLLVKTLYADPVVSAFLHRHKIPRRPQRGTIAARFPTPVTVTDQILREAYIELGLSARQIELLTGQPADQLLDQLHDAGISPRRGLPTSPWLARQFSEK